MLTDVLYPSFYPSIRLLSVPVCRPASLKVQRAASIDISQPTDSINPSPLTNSINPSQPFTPLNTSNEPSLSEAQRAWDSLVSTSEPYRVVFTIHTLLCLFRLHVDKQQYSETIGVLRRLLEVSEEVRSQN